MDWKTLFLSPEGRIGQKDFWLGFAILFGVWFVLNFIPLLGHPLQLALMYCWICLWSKRLHDMDKSGFLQLIPIVLFTVCIVVGISVVGASVVAAIVAGETQAIIAAVFSGLLLMGLIGLSFLVFLIFLMWVGLGAGTPGANRFGPAPTRSLFDSPSPAPPTPPAPPVEPAG